MGGISTKKPIHFDDNPFDRQTRIDWWCQDKISQAKIMVVGAGALGNEVLKNLALLGARNILIVDFDTISTSNLSRTVLFRREDKGKNKAEIAAQRTKELCLAEDVRIDWIHCDIVNELGAGIYREMDLVLGCLDNVEARLSINEQCWLTGTPWMDAGTNQLNGHVATYIPHDAPCYECTVSQESYAKSRKRYSCDNIKKKFFEEGKMATIQITSAIVSAIQVQEAMKYLHGLQVKSGQKSLYNGMLNEYEYYPVSTNPHCTTHLLGYDKIYDTELSASMKLKDVLYELSNNFFGGRGVSIELRKDYIVLLSCTGCGSDIEFYRPIFRIFDTDLVCECCRSNLNRQSLSRTSNPKMEFIRTLNEALSDTILEQTLLEIGIPEMDIITVSIGDEERYFQLSGDRRIVMPNISKKQNTLNH